MGDYEQVTYKRLDRVARVTMNRPEYRNAQSTQLLHELDAAFQEAVEDEQVRVIILSGEGKDFSSGHDLGTPDQTEYANRHPRRGRSAVERSFTYSWDNFVQMSLRWRDIPKPTIAQVHGWCIFGGWIIASSMDMIVAAHDARFLTNLLQYFTLPYDVGTRKAKEILFDNRPISAQDALELGFVNHVYPREELERETLEFANRIAESSAFFLRMAKLAVNHVEDAMGFHAAVRAAHSHYQLSQTHDTLRAREADVPDRRTSDGRKLGVVENLVRRAEQQSRPSE